MYPEEQNKILDALKLISQTCSCYDNCKPCPFGTEEGECKIQFCPPCQWEIQDDQTWRAMK